MSNNDETQILLIVIEYLLITVENIFISEEVGPAIIMKLSIMSSKAGLLSANLLIKIQKYMSLSELICDKS